MQSDSSETEPLQVPVEVKIDTGDQNFDMRQATFYLVAAVFTLYGGALLFAEFMCFTFQADKCLAESTGKIAEGFASLLASALAFAAGQSGTMRRH